MERKCYHIPTLPAGTTVATVDWNVVPAAQIDTYRWLDGGYEPHAEARLAFLPGYGFALRAQSACRIQRLQRAGIYRLLPGILRRMGGGKSDP